MASFPRINVEPDVDNSRVDKGETYKLEIICTSRPTIIVARSAHSRSNPVPFGAPQAAFGALTAPRSRAKRPAMGLQCNLMT
jgi:hypothetical protein